MGCSSRAPASSARRAGWLYQKIERRRSTHHCHAVGAETPADAQVASGSIEPDGLFEIIDVDVDEEIHRFCPSPEV
jgi:hypothetical protein